MKTALAYLLAIVFAELITVIPVLPVVGIISHIVVLVLLLVHSAVDTNYPYRPLLLSLSLAPLVRIISLSMPLAGIPQIWWYPIIYIPLLVAAVLVMRLLNYAPRETGFTWKKIYWQLAVAPSGFLFGVAEYFILKPEPMIAELTWQAALLPAFVLLSCTGFVEEVIFRGVLQRSSTAAFRNWGMIYTSFLFAVLHIGFLSVIDVAFVFAVAVFFAWVVKRTGSLLGVTLSHGITNIILFVVAPFIF